MARVKERLGLQGSGQIPKAPRCPCRACFGSCPSQALQLVHQGSLCNPRGGRTSIFTEVTVQTMFAKVLSSSCAAPGSQRGWHGPQRAGCAHAVELWPKGFPVPAPSAPSISRTSLASAEYLWTVEWGLLKVHPFLNSQPIAGTGM